MVATIMEGNVVQDQERGSFYASLADGEYRLADIPALKEQWLTGTAPVPKPENGSATARSPLERSSPLTHLPPGTTPTHEVSVIVRDGKLAGIRVGDGEPTTTFARSRDFEHKWTDTESAVDVSAPGA